MGKIQRLSSQLANMIAAGEVIERPSSVVKELLENAIDAKATRIEITIQDAGRTLIEVADNGTGMDQGDLRLSIARHATSKLLTEESLFRIQTLGFRGEALPSIASVSQLSITTSTGEKGGHQLTLVDEKPIISAAARSIGTTVTVKDLFYNTPARLKYLKNDAIETSAIVDVVMRAAFAHPSIAFVLHGDGKRVFVTDGRGSLINTITACLGSTTATHMLPISYEDPDVKLTGFFGKPDIAKSHRYGMYVSVNGRSVFMPKIQQALIEAYRPFLPPVRFPMVVLQLTIEPNLLDVNVHPAKRDIRFSKEDHLRKVLLNLVEKTLKRHDVVATPLHETLRASLPSSPTPISSSEEDIQPILLTFAESESTEPALTVMGVLDATYVLCKDDHEGYYVIDQHAAHERIHYEEQLARIQEHTYAMEPLIPLVVDISPSDKTKLTASLLNQLKHVGVELEWFGDFSLKVNTLPTWAASIGAVYVDDLLQQLFHETALNEDKLRLYAIASKACKMSIKAHDHLDHDSLNVLVKRLLQCQFPYACPHGRPTMIHYSVAQLERLFNRTGF